MTHYYKFPTGVHTGGDYRLALRPSVRMSVLLWRSRSQLDLEAKLCPAQNFVIWSWILKLFNRNDHHIEMTCCEQNLGCYHEGHGHSMTLQQNCVRPITLLFEVGFYNYFTEMITILRWHVAHNIWVTTLKVNVTAWPCSKIVSGQLLCYLKSDFTTISQKWSPYCDDMSHAIFWSLPLKSRSQHNLAAKTCLTHNFVIWSQFYNFLTEIITILRLGFTTLPIIWILR